MFNKIAAAAALVIASSTAFAAPAKPFYVGVDVGTTEIDTSFDHEPSYGAFVGYKLSDNFAAEYNYRHFGKPSFEAGPGITGTATLSQHIVSVVGTLPLGHGFSFLGRVGFNYVVADLEFAGMKLEDTRNRGVYGAGLGYTITPAISTRVEIIRPSGGSTNISAGLQFSF